MAAFKHLIIEIPADASDERVRDVFAALARNEIAVRVPFGNDVRGGRLLIIDEDGVLKGAQG